MAREISAGGVVVRRSELGWEVAVIEPQRESAGVDRSDKKRKRKMDLAGDHSKWGAMDVLLERSISRTSKSGITQR